MRAWLPVSLTAKTWSLKSFIKTSARKALRSPTACIINFKAFALRGVRSRRCQNTFTAALRPFWRCYINGYREPRVDLEFSHAVLWSGCCEGLDSDTPTKTYKQLREREREWKSTYWLRSLDGHKPVVALLPADIAEGPVVPGVLGDVADLMDWVVMQEHLHGTDTKCYRIRRCGPCEIG